MRGAPSELIHSGMREPVTALYTHFARTSRSVDSYRPQVANYTYNGTFSLLVMKVRVTIVRSIDVLRCRTRSGYPERDRLSTKISRLLIALTFGYSSDEVVAAALVFVRMGSDNWKSRVCVLGTARVEIRGRRRSASVWSCESVRNSRTRWHHGTYSRQSMDPTR